MSYHNLPELLALDSAVQGVRIPPDVTVPLTPRVRALLDTPTLHRLSRVSQLGLVALVYPGAVHSRLEHSLGVYRLALEFLAHLRRDQRFVAAISEDDAAAFTVAALAHDIGHWPFCHPIEDMGLEELPRHETLVESLLSQGETREILTSQWRLDPARVAALIEGTATDRAGRLLHSLLSGPIDVDKMDYLARDSLHAGVPYGRHFDQSRLLSSLCLDEAGEALAITEKGRTAAELMVFARYVMFSEVYWHHAVRAATCMLQRAVWLLRDHIDVPHLIRMDDRTCIQWLQTAARGTPTEPLVEGLFGASRGLLKRVTTFDALSHPTLHRALAGRSYADKAEVSARLAASLAAALGRPIPPELLIVDAPPAEREVEFNLQVRGRPRHQEAAPPWHTLAELSPVVRSLAREQFDHIVKRVRLFAPADLAGEIAAYPALEELLLKASTASGRSTHTP